MPKTVSSEDVRAFINKLDDLDVIRFHYCYQLGSTFVCLAQMENSIVDKMTICDQIKVAKIDGDKDISRLVTGKIATLRTSTLGTLINILSSHGVEQKDTAYLRWIKTKRDFFIHRFFHSGAWPGDLSASDLHLACRSLRYLEIIFLRATDRLWRVFERANFMECIAIGETGVLMVNPNLFEGDELA